MKNKDFEINPTPPINTYSHGSRYKTFNQDCNNPPQVSNFQQNAYNQKKPMNQFNNFDNTNRMMQPNYNNMNPQMMQMNQPVMNKLSQPTQIQQNSKINAQEMSIDDIGEFIYSYCEKLYPK